MANIITPKRSSVAAKVPLATDLQVGEIAINLADGLIYSKNGSGVVISIGGTPGAFLPLTGGTMTGAISFAAAQTWPTFNQNTTGNAATATKLATARTITLAGDVAGAASFTGEANISITTTVADDSHAHIIANVDGLQAVLDAKAALASPALTGVPTAPTAAGGTDTTQLATTAFVQASVSDYALPLSGGVLTGPLSSQQNYINSNADAASGISWYSSTHTAWTEYMAVAGAVGCGPSANITAPSGTYVTSWALRSFVGNTSGYGWTWESGAWNGQPTVVAELRASDGTLKVGNVLIGANQVLHGGNYTNYLPSKTGSGASGTWNIDITGNAGTATALATGRTIAISGAATGTATTFDGASNITIPVTALNASNLNAGTIPDARLTGAYTGFSHKLDGTNAIFSIPSDGSPYTNARTAYALAEYRSGLSSQTGAIVFVAPSGANSIIHQLEVQGMLYNSPQIIRMAVQGYTSAGAWVYPRKSNFGTLDVQTRWGKTPDGKNCLILGDVDTTWSYPHISIARALFSHTGASDAYCSGWTVATVTDLTGYISVTADIVSGVMNTSVDGNSATSTALATGRTIAMTGDVTWISPSFNGSANVTAAATLAPSGAVAGTYSNATITIDAKGRVTSASSGADITISNDTTTSAAYYPLFATSTSGTLSTVKVSGTKLNYNPSTGTLNANLFAGLVSSATGGAGFISRNTSTASNTTKAISYALQGTDTVGTVKDVASVYATPVDANWVASVMSFWVRSSNTIASRATLDGSGNFAATGNVSGSSDERLKTDWVELPTDFVERLSQVKSGTYTRLDNGMRQIGVSAQSLRPVAPEGVMDGEYLSVAYGNVALAASVQLAKEVISLRARIERLESLIEA
jgi:hypothetical protein